MKCPVFLPAQAHSRGHGLDSGWVPFHLCPGKAAGEGPEWAEPTQQGEQQSQPEGVQGKKEVIAGPRSKASPTSPATCQWHQCSDFIWHRWRTVLEEVCWQDMWVLMTKWNPLVPKLPLILIYLVFFFPPFFLFCSLSRDFPDSTVCVCGINLPLSGGRVINWILEKQGVNWKSLRVTDMKNWKHLCKHSKGSSNDWWLV